MGGWSSFRHGAGAHCRGDRRRLSGDRSRDGLSLRAWASCHSRDLPTRRSVGRRPPDQSRGVYVCLLMYSGWHHRLRLPPHHLRRESPCPAGKCPELPGFVKGLRPEIDPDPRLQLPKPCTTAGRPRSDCRRRELGSGDSARCSGLPRGGARRADTGRVLQVEGNLLARSSSSSVSEIAGYQMMATETLVRHLGRGSSVCQGSRGRGGLAVTRGRSCGRGDQRRLVQRVRPWIRLDRPPLFEDGRVSHDRGVVADVPGLYFVGLKGLYSVSSAQVNGVGRDAERVARLIGASRSSVPPGV